MAKLTLQLHRRKPYATAAPLLIFLALFFVAPLLVTFGLAFLSFDPTTFATHGVTLENLRRFVFDPFYQFAMLRTFGIALATTLLALAVGYPVAYHLHSIKSPRIRTLLILLVLLPVTVSFVVTAFAWIVILGGNGLINDVLLHGGIIDRPLKLLSTNAGVILVLTYTFTPFMIMNIYASLEAIDPALVRSASVLGARPARVFQHVILPLSLPGVFSGSVLVFSLALGAFVSPTIIGGSQVKTIPVLIFNFAVGVYDWPGASALSLLFLLAAGSVTWYCFKALNRGYLSWLAPQ